MTNLLIGLGLGLALGLFIGLYIIPKWMFGHELEPKPSYRNPAHP